MAWIMLVRLNFGRGISHKVEQKYFEVYLVRAQISEVETKLTAASNIFQHKSALLLIVRFPRKAFVDGKSKACEVICVGWTLPNIRT